MERNLFLPIYTGDPFDFEAAVVLFNQIDARLPALIRGESVWELAGEGE